jgi:hypothetical protein
VADDVGNIIGRVTPDTESREVPIGTSE